MIIYNLIHILNTMKPNEKIHYIKSLDDGDKDLFLWFSDIVLNPMLSFYITELSLVDTDDEIGTFSLADGINKLMYLNDKGSSSKQDIIELNNIYSAMLPYNQELLSMVVSRTLRCGINIKSIQKINKDFCPKFPVMKCNSYDLKKIKKNIHFPAFSQTKLDGARMSAIINDTVKLYSGNGRQFLGLDELCKALANKACCVLDGELIVVDENDHILPRKIGNGILNKSIKGTITNKESAQVRFIVWDIISIDCFFNKNNSKSSKYQFRLQELYGIVNKINSKLCTHVKSKLVNSLSEAAEDFRKQTAFGEEGTILKSVDNIWSSTRASDQIKFKEVFPCEMKITGIYLGKPNSKYKNCIGGFNIESRCGKVKCNVGSGLTDTDRGFNLNEEEFKVLTQKYLNSIISIEYNARIHSENKTEESLFLPRVIDFRLDKNEADTLETMKNQEKSTRELGELK